MAQTQKMISYLKDLVIAFLALTFIIVGCNSGKEKSSEAAGQTENSVVPAVPGINSPFYNKPIPMADAILGINSYHTKNGTTTHSNGMWYQLKSIEDYMKTSWPAVITKMNRPLTADEEWVVGHYFMVDATSKNLKFCVIPTIRDKVKKVLLQIWIKDASGNYVLNTADYPILSKKDIIDELAFDEGDMFP